jgi:hypothetical protein
MLDIRKLLFCYLCSLAVLASAVIAGNVMTNGDFATNMSGWSNVDTTTATGAMYVTYYSGAGNPAGSVMCWTDVNDVVGGNNNHRFGQVLRVNKGQKYKLTGDWKGDLNGLMVLPEYATTARNWAEIFVGFFDSAPTVDEWGTIRFKKAWGGTPLNTTTGIWDWESILSSPDGTNPGPGDGVFTATGSYMTVALNVGGRVKSAAPAYPVWVYIDNFKVLPCHDASGTDCSADFKYVAWIANNWLACNIDPATSCY